MRAFELAKAFGVRSNQLLAKVKELKLPVRNSFASVSEADIKKLAKAFDKPVPTEVPTSIGVAKPKAPPKPKAEKEKEKEKKKAAPKKAAKKPAAKKAPSRRAAKAKPAEAEPAAEAAETPPEPAIGEVVRPAPAEAPPEEAAVAAAAEEPEPAEADPLGGVELGGVVRAAPEAAAPTLPGRGARKARKVARKKPAARRPRMQDVALDLPHAGFRAPPVPEGELPEGVVVEKDEETKIHVVRPRRSTPSLAAGGADEPTSILDPERFRISPQVEALLRSYQPTRRRRQPRTYRPRGRRHARPRAPAVRPTEADLAPPLTVRSISQAFKIKSKDLLARLAKQEVHLTVDDTVEEDVAQMLGMELGIEVRIRRGADLERELTAAGEEAGEAGGEPRPPVVAVLGHVDHGKTSLLDAIRETNVAAGEVGGITQHIGASVVEHGGRRLVFIDTPGHEAFTAMRARGANVTDIAVLVVAADDGVMPQTEEAVSHAKAAGVAIVVAINKCDLPGANPARVKQQLAGLELIPEEWGGSVGMVECSAVTKQGLGDLLDRIALEAEVLELTADPGRPARGTVLEASVSEGRGNLATVLVQDGTLRRGDTVLAGGAYGRVKQLVDDGGRELEEAGPSTPVAVLGLSGVPEAGEAFLAVDDLAKARQVAEGRQARARVEALVPRRRVTLESLHEALADAGAKELPLILKADAAGTLEALRETLTGLSTDEVKVRLLHAGVGAISESDVILADASGAVILGFSVVTEGGAARVAEDKGVQIRTYRVIYELADDVRKGLEGLLEPEEETTVTGHVAVRQVFRISRVGTVAGGYVTDGVVARASRVRLARDGIVIHEGRLASLKRFKDDVREVREGFECGLKVEGYDDVKVGDVIEALEVRQIARSLSGGPRRTGGASSSGGSSSSAR